MITERDISVLLALYRYYILNRMQLQTLCFSGDTSGRVARRRLLQLLELGYIARAAAQVVYPHHPQLAPAYFSTPKGLALLAEHFEDDKYLLGTTQTPHGNYLLHWLAVSDTHLQLDAALEHQSAVTCPRWINEWDIANPTEREPERRFRLFVLLQQQPRMVCAPDAAFLLELQGHRQVFYLEQDRNTSGVRQIAASKTTGYSVMLSQKTHYRHFPENTEKEFRVLMLTPTPQRRDALRRAMKDKPGVSVWRFASVTDINAETFLFGKVFYPCVGEAVSLLKQTPVTSETATI
jgi:Replication-relaxation